MEIKLTEYQNDLLNDFDKRRRQIDNEISLVLSMIYDVNGVDKNSAKKIDINLDKGIISIQFDEDKK